MDILASFTRNIKLGHTGENEAARVAFSLVPFKEEFPGGRPALLVKPPKGGNAYPVALTVKGDTAYWTVTAADTAVAGFGQCELQWYAGDTLAKSDKFDFWVAQALEAGAEPPDEPSKRWFDAIQAQIGDISKLTTKAKDNLVAAINEAVRSGGGSGGAGTIDMRTSDGYIQYSNDDGTTWENLIAVADLKGADGAPGTDGKDGAPGKDGVTPDIKIGTVTTLPAGSEATASMGGTAAQPTLNLGIPKGADGDNANVTKDAVVGALGFTPISADDVPVKKVNSATGDVKSTFYVTITTAEDESISADKTLEEIYTAYEKGYAVYAKTATSPQIIVPLTIAVHSGNDYAVVFNGAVTFGDTTEYAISNDGSGWTIYAKDIAFKDNIPTIPTALKNPHPLNIKIGNATTIYDGSAEQTVEIPDGGGTVTEADIKNALGYKPIGAADVPVKSVNGQTGAVKTSWYFDVTGSVASPATTQTVAQIVAAQTAGFAPICKAVLSDFKGLPATLPALLISDMLCVFGGIGSTGGDTFYLTVMIDGAGTLTAKTDDVAAKGDIPTSLKNPNALSIKVGDNTTSYDGSAAKSVEIPEQTYNLTETDKEDIAADVIAGGQEVQVGEPLAGPTDAQVSSAVSSWLTEHPEATTTVQDGSVSVEKLGYGKHIYGSKPYFCNSVGSGAVSWGSIGVVVPCKAGDTIYCNFNMPTSGAYQKPQLLAALPENQYGAIAPIGTIEKDDTTKAYTVPESATTAKAMYLPQSFNAIPAANNGSVEDALAWINKTMGTDGKWCAQNVPFEDYDAWYQTAQAELFDIDESCNKLMYASLYQAVSKLVGAKVAVLGDSLTEQSACSFITSAYNDRWMENVLRDTAQTGDDGKTYKGSGWFALIARKYKIKWWCAGHGAQWWYSTTARPNGATAMVRKLIDGTDEFDYIVLEYGTNDILSGYTHIGTAEDEASETATTSCGAIKWCIEQLQTRFPEASIVVILPNIHSGANGEPPAMQQTYLDTVVPILKKYGVRRVNMAEDSGIVKSMMSTDGVHLRWPVVSNNITYYTNDTPAVRKFSKCLEAELLKA